MKGHTTMAMVMWMGAAAVCAGAQERLKVVVLDQAGIGSGEMSYAMDLGRRLFDVLGVETSWTVCHRGEPCPMPEPGAYIRLSVVPWTKGTILGFANTDSTAAGAPQAYVFHIPVTRLAMRTHQTLGVALACVLAHESLHLLGVEHGPYGIMRESFDTQDLVNVTRSRPMLDGTQIHQLRGGLSRLTAIRLAAAR